MLNVALSGSLDGGIGSGILQIAGPSRHFKSSFSLEIASAFLEQKPDSVLLFYDSEFGSPQAYFSTFRIPLDRVIHIPVTNIEELKFDLVSQLEGLDKNDEVIIIIDSIGNIASKKEVEDAINEKSVADMTRAKALKGLFRMITPQLRIKDIPLIFVNHTYATMSMYSTQTPGGGSGALYASDAVWIVGRRTNKDDDKNVSGYDFIINVDKSRTIRERSVVPISVSWKGGIEKNSGLLEIGLLGKYVIKPKKGLYVGVNPKTGEIINDEADKENTVRDEFWKPIFEQTDFKEFVRRFYSIPDGSTSFEETRGTNGIDNNIEHEDIFSTNVE